jgi:LmeA-like phospholipid-binding
MASRGTRVWRTVAIVLVVLVVLFIGADRLGDYVAERAAADTIQSSQHLSSRPDVDITGFPFLTQLARSKFDKITIDAKDIPVGNSGHLLDLSQVHVVLHSLTVSRDFSQVHAATATATATASYAELSRTLGLDVSYAGGGQIKAAKRFTVAGTSFTAGITTRPALHGTALSFTNTAIDHLGQLGADAAAALNRVFDLQIPLAGVPFDIKVTSLSVGESGVVIQLAGSDLQYGN